MGIYHPGACLGTASTSWIDIADEGADLPEEVIPIARTGRDVCR